MQTWGSTDLLQTLLKNDESVTTGKGAATYHRFERGGKPEYGQLGT